MVEVAIPLEVIGGKNNFYAYLMSGSPAGSDWLDKSAVSVNINQSLATFPKTCWKPMLGSSK